MRSPEFLRRTISNHIEVIRRHTLEAKRLMNELQEYEEIPAIRLPLQHRPDMPIIEFDVATGEIVADAHILSKLHPVPAIIFTALVLNEDKMFTIEELIAIHYPEATQLTYTETDYQGIRVIVGRIRRAIQPVDHSFSKRLQILHRRGVRWLSQSSYEKLIQASDPGSG